MFGVHTEIDPIFSHNVFFRPNAAFAFGEVTDLIALNLEAIYRLPSSNREDLVGIFRRGTGINVPAPEL
jgi:hypothetical protein